MWGKFHKIKDLQFTPNDWRETIDGGQAFTWYECAENEFEGVFTDIAVKARLNNGTIEASFLKGINESIAIKKFADYLDTNTDYSEIRSALHKTADTHMLKALKIYPTLRILRQNPSEAIICFICSSSKRIVQIKQCVKLLSEKFGKHIGNGFYALPDFKTLANAKLEDILECKLGFRASYLKKTAQKIVEDNFDPLSLRQMPYTEAKNYLCSLTGIGDKVADCILLFGCSRFEAFPVDTWIKQAMCQMYNTDSSPKKIRDFASKKFPNYAGFAQQLIFATKRNSLM